MESTKSVFRGQDQQYVTKISGSQFRQFDDSQIFPTDSRAEIGRDCHGTESSDDSQDHGRKMLRRVANRRSAQQSRARKKALMGDLKIENARLQKLADILDSQPELTFCIDIIGNIKFISESALNCMKSSAPDDSDEEPNHINQILTLESVETVLESVAEVRNISTRKKLNCRDVDQDSCISSVQSVCYHDANGFQVAGYVRCSRLIKRSTFDDSEMPIAVDTGPAAKKVRILSPADALSSAASHLSCNIPINSCHDASSSRLSIPATDAIHDFKSQRYKPPQEEEFVCVIRPADASFPYVKGSRLFSSLLSTASMVAHDLELRSSGCYNQADPLEAGWSKEDYTAAGRLSAHHLYQSSGGQQGGSGSSDGTKNSTSSETNSEDYGEQDETPL